MVKWEFVEWVELVEIEVELVEEEEVVEVELVEEEIELVELVEELKIGRNW